MPTDNLTIKQAARLLGVHHITVRRWIKTGKIKATWEYEGDQGKRLISRDQVIELLEKQGKTTPESGQLEQVKEAQVALSINKVNVYLKHLFKVERESRLIELKNAIASLSVKLFIAIGIVLIAGIAIALSIAYIAGVKQEANQKVLKGEMFKGFAYLKEGQKSNEESLKTIMTEELATAGEQIRNLEASNQDLKRELLEVAQVEGKATKAEIEEIQKRLDVQNQAIIGLMDAIRELIKIKSAPPATPIPTITPGPRPTIEPAKTPALVTTPEPPAPEEEGGGFLGIF